MSLEDRTALVVFAVLLAAAVVWQVAPASWAGCVDAPARAKYTRTAAEFEALDAKVEAVLGPPGTLVEEQLLRATLGVPGSVDLGAGYLSITVNRVRRVFIRSPTGAVWMRTE